MSDARSGGTTTLLVAPSEGRLTELRALRDRFVGLGPVEWVTSDSSPARHLLAGETVHLVTDLDERDVRGAMGRLPSALRLLSERGIGRVVATGTGLALAYVLAARRLGLPAHYVESAERVTRPGLTGAMVARIPGVHLYAQHPWRERGWSLRGSVFDGYVAAPVVPPTRLDRVVVTLGSGHGSAFRSAVEELSVALREIGGASLDVLWQTGSTDVSGLGLDARSDVAYDELARAVSEADLVIGHAGVGAALLALDTGRIPVLIPRRRHRGEHVDDHQVDLARALHGRGLAQHVEVGAITPAALTAGMGRTALRSAGSTMDFHLSAEPGRTGRSLRRTRRVEVPQPVAPLRPAPETVPSLVVDRAVRPVPVQLPVTEPVERPGRVTVRVPLQRRPRLTVLPGGLADDSRGDLVRR